MRNVIVPTYMTLDGVMGAPENWTPQFWNDEQQEYAHDQLFASDALFLGRETYQGFAEAWPSMTDEDGGPTTDLTLVDTTTFRSGVVILQYRPDAIEREEVD